MPLPNLCQQTSTAPSRPLPFISHRCTRPTLGMPMPLSMTDSQAAWQPKDCKIPNQPAIEAAAQAHLGHADAAVDDGQGVVGLVGHNVDVLRGKDARKVEDAVSALQGRCTDGQSGMMWMYCGARMQRRWGWGGGGALESPGFMQ